MSLATGLTGADWIGLVGVALYVIAYGGLAIGRIALADARYYALNAAGGVLMIYSLVFRFNLASFICQVMWLAFTIVGFVRWRRRGVDKQH